MSTTPAPVRVKFLGPLDLVQALQAELDAEPYTTVLSFRKDEDPTALGLNLADVATLIALLQGAEMLLRVAHWLYYRLQAHRGERIVLETSFERLEIAYHTKLTEEEVHEKLKKLVGSL